MASIPDFTGIREIDAPLRPADFLKRARVAYRAQGADTDAAKMEDIGDHFKDDTPADAWFKALTGSSRTVWADFCTAFMLRFQAAPSIVKPPAQLLAELGSMRITMDELANETVTVGGQKIPVLRDFAMRVNDGVTQAGVATEGGAMLWVFHDSLPPWLRARTGAVPPADWEGMVRALNDVPDRVVQAEMTQYREQRALKLEQSALRDRVSAVDALIKRLGNMHLSSAGATNGNQRNTGTTNAPVQGPTREPGTAGGGAGGTAGGGAGGSAGGGTGAAGGGGAGVAGGGARRIPTDAEKAALRTVLANTVARRAPNTPEGRVAYQAQVNEWNQRNGHLAAGMIDVAVTGYPLTPGTAAPRSGECWKCGVAENPNHKGKACPYPLIPLLEKRFRNVCTSYLGVDVQLMQAATVNAVGVEVAGALGVPWYGDGDRFVEVEGEGEGF
ncbi:hypothetical protein C8F04DRAFT_98570 [Mycena alexandri]|uniref:Uncharacterized protein n=1 Tax=Mycena alexandri TaxID=1745969 RepID=A0AAD6XBI5_9AGAR|nr:hypothetical protein C8F04DRAFT_98570 [Mycena alexandri]